MDPDETLAQMLEEARSLIATTDPEQQPEAVLLADHVLNLHEWLRKGGYPPALWAGAYRATLGDQGRSGL